MGLSPGRNFFHTTTIGYFSGLQEDGHWGTKYPLTLAPLGGWGWDQKKVGKLDRSVASPFGGSLGETRMLFCFTRENRGMIRVIIYKEGIAPFLFLGGGGPQARSGTTPPWDFASGEQFYPGVQNPSLNSEKKASETTYFVFGQGRKGGSGERGGGGGGLLPFSMGQGPGPREARLLATTCSGLG